MSDWVVENAQLVHSATQEDPLIRLMAFGVVRALRKESESASDYTAFSRNFASIDPVPIYFSTYSTKTLYVDMDTTISQAISQALWFNGGSNSNAYDLFGELPGKGLILIGKTKSLLDSLEAAKNENVQRFILKKKFSRMTPLERNQDSEAEAAYHFSRKLYMRNRYNYHKAIAIQLCLFQIIAEESDSILSERIQITKIVFKYIPSEVILYEES